jgi:hypothetical protein
MEKAIVLVSRKTKVSNFDETIRVDEKIGRLQVTMEDISRVDVLESSQDLVREALDVIVRELLVRGDDMGQVSVHELVDKVQVIEVLVAAWLDDV